MLLSPIGARTNRCATEWGFCRLSIVIPAKAGIQKAPHISAWTGWIPAFAGMTGRNGGCCGGQHRTAKVSAYEVMPGHGNGMAQSAVT